jgi:ribosomal protein S18 acetylase RimI-like enzyme
MEIRHAEPEDYKAVIGVVNEWWGGRQMATMLPKLFFVHFKPTSFVAEQEGKIRGFVCGFVSQTNPTQAYIHFLGVDPDYRKDGLGRKLYEQFFEAARSRGCTEALCITSPVNKTSIAFHRRMGFEILPGNTEVDGIAATADYDGRGEARILFRREL